ncbi:hypothetical protein AUP68_15859 [Ilyonectria robusta]
MHYTRIFLLALFALVSIARSCTLQTATSLEQYLENGSGAGSADITNEAHDLLDGGLSKRGSELGALVLLGVLNPRATSLKCTATETCFSFLDVPFCVSLTTWDYHDADETTGNLLSGDYTLADGQKGNLYKGPFPTPTTFRDVVVTSTADPGNAATETDMVLGPTTQMSAGMSESTSEGTSESASDEPTQTASSSNSPASQTTSAAENHTIKTDTQVVIRTLLAVGGLALLHTVF